MNFMPEHLPSTALKMKFVTHFPSILFTYSSDPNLNLSGKPTFFSNFHSCLHMKPCVTLMKSGLTTTIGFINEIGDNLVLKTNESEREFYLARCSN
jgi:hypothetical protein